MSVGHYAGQLRGSHLHTYHIPVKMHAIVKVLQFLFSKQL